MANQYVIGPNGPTSGNIGQAIYQPGRPHDPVVIYNTGTSTIYLDHDGPLNPSTNGVPLTAGSSIPWDKDLPLWVACPTSGTITTSDNSATPFDAGAVASQILAQGLAQQVGQQVSAQILVNGVPTIDQPTTLFNSTAWAIADNTVVTPAGTLDMRKYTSYSIGNAESGAYLPALPGLTRLWKVAWYADAGATILITVDYYSVYCWGGFFQIQGACKGPFMQFICTNVTLGAAQTGNTQIVGYLSVIPERTFLGGTNQVNASGLIVNAADYGYGHFFRYGGSVAAAGTVSDYPLIYAGAAILNVYDGTAGTLASRLEFRLLNAFTASRVATLVVPSGTVTPFAGSIPVNLPPYAVVAQLVNTTAAAQQLEMSLTMS